MRVDELVAEACAQTGLDDFGAGSFREGLEALVDSLDGEAWLNELGRIALPAQIVTCLGNRLRVTDWRARHPELGSERVERPIFIVGLPRTGTTLLSHLLAQDPALRSLLGWESQRSVPPPEAATLRSDPRIAEARAAGSMLESVNPAFKAMHHEEPDEPTECVAVYAQEFKSILWETLANVPGYGRWLSDVDYASACAYHRQVLQLLQSRAPGRWSLKSPGHCLAIDAVAATYPDASFVATHRDPVAVVASTCSLVGSLSGTFSDADHRPYIARHWTDRLYAMVQRMERFRAGDASREARFLDVAYAELVADPLGVVRRLYGHVGAELRPEVEAAMVRHLDDHRPGKYGRHAYALSDLLLERDELESLFGEYRARYEIAGERVP